MGRKRKVPARPDTSSSKAAEFTKLAINSYEDVADSEDDFLSNRDKISLEEGREAKRRRKAQEEDQLLELSDEEMLAYPSSDDDNSDEAENLAALSFHDEQQQDAHSVKTTKATTSRSDPEEVEETDAASWGESRQDYYGADNIDTEQAALEEEAEAKRLQERQMEGMASLETHYGLSYQEDEEGDRSSDEDNVVTELLPEIEISEGASAEERQRLLQLRYPELSSIAKDWLNMHGLYEQVLEDAKLARRILDLQRHAHDPRSRQPHPAVTRYTALSAYLATCAMYFAVLTSTAAGTNAPVVAMGPKKLREHPIIQNILDTRRMWEKVEELPRQDMVAELAALERNMAERIAPKAKSAPFRSLADSATSSTKREKHSRHPGEAQAVIEARRLERMRKVNADLADLDTLAASRSNRNASFVKSKESGKLIINDEDSDLGDETELTHEELAAKSQRKKSLKFYTSQIAQKANKQGLKGREAGGDADIPHRERLRDREARLNAAAERRGRQEMAPGEELGNSSDDDHGGDKRERSGRQDPAEEDYYDLVAARSKQKKADRKEVGHALAQAQTLDARGGVSESLGLDDKRKVTYSILRNKGLTPHRKKEVRNPRVKKKLKYESKLKKLGSTKQVYRGGEARGGYGGELSGIKTGLVKSIKM